MKSILGTVSLSTPGEPSAVAIPESEPSLAKGAALGRYVVLDALGHGAIGIVYRAFDPQLDRRVAIKLLRRTPAFASGEQERLLREGKTMARLSHPNVVTVYDVGTYDDQVFVAMELIDGVTLRSWLLARRSWRDIVGMFVQAGRGLAAAHTAGIVHRDFKPDNVLVGTDGRVRVVDFGLAWTPEGAAPSESGSASPEPASTAWPSATLGSMVGTPRYSPPEQLDGRRVDPSADQFAFCASLWEALYEAAPFAGDDMLTLIANIREGRLPRAPPNRGAPRPVFDALRRGLSGEPEQRFPSMDTLLSVLEDDPALVRRKWLGPTIAVIVALAGVTVAASARIHERQTVCDGGDTKLGDVWNPARKASVRRALLASGKPWAGETADGVTAELDRYSHDWSAMRRAACEATNVRHEQSPALMDLRMQCLDERLEQVQSVATLLSQPDDSLLALAPKAAYSLTPLRGCADTRALSAPVPLPGDPAVRADVEGVRAALTKVKALNELGRYADADRMAAVLTDRAQHTQYDPVVAEALEARGDSLEYLADYPRAVESYRQALLSAERGLDRTRAVSAMVNLVWALGVDQGLHEPAHQYAAHAKALLSGLGGDVELEANLASHEATVFRDEGHASEAESLALTTVEKRKLVFGTSHPRYAMAVGNLAAIRSDQARFADALSLSREALDINARTLGEHHPDYALSLQDVAGALNLVGQKAEARKLVLQAITVFADALGPDHPRVASADFTLGLIDMDLSELAEAEHHLRHALAVAESLRGGGHVYLAEYAKALADVLVKAHRPSEALDLYHRDLEVVEKSGNGPETAAAQTGLGVALIGLGRAPEALMLLDAALQWREANDPNQRELADTRFGVARALVGSRGDRARARSLAVRAVEGYSADPGALDDRRVAEAWLADLEGGAADRPANADSGVILRGLRRPDGSHGARP